MSNLPSTKKSLGQHWLTDNEALSSIADAAGIEAGDTVLEIGPGIGTLTKLLVRQAKQVVAVELDRALVEGLSERVHADNLTVIQSDILSFDLTSLPAGYKVVANIPYYLTSNLIRVLSESSNPASTVVLLVQKEVAERVVAEPGSMSLLSVSAQFYWVVSLGRVVEANLFTPPPKVDSQILVMHRRDEPLFDVEEKQFFRLVKAGFNNRRKTVVNSLSAGMQLDKSLINDYLVRAGIVPTARPQQLSLEQWNSLHQVINS